LRTRQNGVEDAYLGHSEGKMAPKNEEEGENTPKNFNGKNSGVIGWGRNPYTTIKGKKKGNTLLKKNKGKKNNSLQKERAILKIKEVSCKGERVKELRKELGGIKEGRRNVLKKKVTDLVLKRNRRRGSGTPKTHRRDGRKAS